METTGPQLDHSDVRKSAEVLYQSLRGELVERVKLRDQVLMAYLGAFAALIGFALRPGKEVIEQNSQTSLLPALLVLVPMLSLGAAAIVCHHQEIMSVFTEYIACELNKWMCPFPVYDKAPARKKFKSRAEIHLLASQVPLLCGPWIFVIMLNSPLNIFRLEQKSTFFYFGLVFELACLIFLIRSRNFRARVLSDIFERNCNEEAVSTVKPLVSEEQAPNPDKKHCAD
jgi:hypothetical protein